MSGTLSGAREARSSWFRRLVSRFLARELSAFVVPGPEILRARGLDLAAAGVPTVSTPRHASVLVLVEDLPPGLWGPAAVAYAQMPRPRAVMSVGAAEVSPLPGPDVAVDISQESLNSGVTELRRLFEGGAFAPRTEDFEADMLRGTTEYACPMHPEVARGEPGTCPECGMELMPREAGEGSENTVHEDEDHESHDHDGPGNEPGEADHEGHDHGDMDFMSMVEMTRGTPRGSDGLQMEWVETPFGPFFPGLPGGLALTFTLDGDTVAQTEVGLAVGVRVNDLGGPAPDFVDQLARLDPLSPVAYRLLALRALESAAGTEVDEETVLGRIGALERERAASHMNWLAGFGCLIGYPWLARRSEELQLATLRAETGDAGRLRTEVQGLTPRVERTPLLRRKLAGVATLPNLDMMVGPVRRAGGREDDARMQEESYRSLGFEPVVVEGGDALARLRVRLEEIAQSLDLLQRTGSARVPRPSGCADVWGTGVATLETPRGPATLRVALEDGEVVSAALDTPSSRHLGMVKTVTEQREVADALVGVGSLDLSPWEMIREAAG